MSAVPDNSARIARMRLLLEQAFAPSTLEIRDDSHLHAGHAGAASGAGHFHLRIRAAASAGQAPLARHRAVYRVLDTLMGADIHALSIDAAAPESST